MNWLNSAVKRFSAEVRGRADSLSAVQRDWITFRRTGKVLEVAVERGVRPGDPKSLLCAGMEKKRASLRSHARNGTEWGIAPQWFGRMQKAGTTSWKSMTGGEPVRRESRGRNAIPYRVRD